MPDWDAYGQLGVGFGLDQISSAIGFSRAKKEAKKQRWFLEYMDSTKYQRAVRDLEKAGLNPILALSKGISGIGGVTGAAAATGQQAPGGYAAAANRAFYQAKTLRAVAAQETAKARTEQNRAAASEYDPHIAAWSLDRIQKEIDVMVEQARTTAKQGDSLSYDAILKATEVPSAKAYEKLYETDFGKVLRIIRAISDALIGPVSGKRGNR